MRRRLKQGAIALAVLAGLLVALVASVFLWFQVRWQPSYADTPYPQLSASTDPEVIEHGRYLFEAVAHCSICHTDEGDFIGNDDVRGMMPTGEHDWEMGPLGTLRAANITVAAPTYTDPELARLLRTGIGKDHVAVPLMIAIGPMDDRDLVALVSYVRSLPETGTHQPPSELTAFGKVLLQTALAGFIAPKELPTPPYAAPGVVGVERGRYLAEGPAYCFGCHTEIELAPIVKTVGPLFAGKRQADPDPYDPTMEMVAPNLTSHATGRLSQLSEDGFVARMRAGRAIKSSPMPWENYRWMTDDDLRSIYRFLASLPPVDRDVGPSYRPVGWSPEG